VRSRLISSADRNRNARRIRYSGHRPWRACWTRKATASVGRTNSRLRRTSEQAGDGEDGCADCHSLLDVPFPVKLFQSVLNAFRLTRELCGPLLGFVADLTADFPFHAKDGPVCRRGCLCFRLFVLLLHGVLWFHLSAKIQNEYVLYARMAGMRTADPIRAKISLDWAEAAWAMPSEGGMMLG